MWSCLDYISVGDYEEHLKKWNKLNILDYQLSLSLRKNIDDNFPKKAIIIVKNGIPESSDPPSWLTNGEKSTIPEFFSFINKEVKRLDNVKHSKKGYFRVWYNIVYHYPTEIYSNDYNWNIELTLQGETEQE